jgi:excisionase family DNA binding protein
VRDTQGTLASVDAAHAKALAALAQAVERRTAALASHDRKVAAAQAGWERTVAAMANQASVEFSAQSGDRQPRSGAPTAPDEDDRKADEVPTLLLTPKQAAQTLAVGRTTLYGLLSTGVLASVRIGGCRRIPYASVRSYVEELQGGPRGDSATTAPSPVRQTIPPTGEDEPPSNNLLPLSRRAASPAEVLSLPLAAGDPEPSLKPHTAAGGNAGLTNNLSEKGTPDERDPAVGARRAGTTKDQPPPGRNGIATLSDDNRPAEEDGRQRLRTDHGQRWSYWSNDWSNARWSAGVRYESPAT